MSNNQLNKNSQKATCITKQDNFLKVLIDENLYTCMYLVNGIKLQGYVTDFDIHVIFFKSNNSDSELMVYKSAISTITRERKVPSPTK